MEQRNTLRGVGEVRSVNVSVAGDQFLLRVDGLDQSAWEKVVIWDKIVPFFSLRRRKYLLENVFISETKSST